MGWMAFCLGYDRYLSAGKDAVCPWICTIGMKKRKASAAGRCNEIAERVMVPLLRIGEYTAFYKVKRKISPERIVEVYITIDGKGEMLRDKTDMFGITSL